MTRRTERPSRAPTTRPAPTLAAVLRAVDDGVVWLDRGGRVVFANPAAGRLFGVSVGGLVGQPLHAAMPHAAPGERACVADGCLLLATLVDGLRRRLAAYRFRRSDGSEFLADCATGALRAGGGVAGAVLLLHDVTEQHRAAEEQRRLLRQAEAAEARFRALLESAPDAIVITRRDGRIMLVNRQAEAQFGYAREELLDQSIEILVPERYRQRHAWLRAEYHAAPRTRPMGAGLDLYARRKDGSEFPVEISLSPLALDGDVLVTAIIRDITDRKRAERQLQETAAALAQQTAELTRSNAELQQFAYVASHDLQEPLRMVASYTQLLARRYRGKLDADAEEFIAFAVDGAQRMQRLINDLLAYSRVGTQGRPLEPVDCERVLERVLADLSAAIAERGALVTHDPLPVVRADPVQLGQVFQNLLSNAIKFHGAAPPRIHISATPEGDRWRLAVRDHGIGIPPEYAERIFVIFQRLHAQHEYPGTGIGLAICKKIVERHGGRIWVESAPGQGATFYFTLPTVEGEP
ncbi:MAG: PAS domain S-box protein [Chloroflexi bacterium]|nr:PAS domain S-box protein [Chloroflexota bacterium]